MTSSQGLREQRDALIARDGPWTGAAMALPDGSSTREGVLPGDDNVRRIIQVVSDLSPKPLEQTRVLDLGCFEGQFAIELALQGAEIVGIEGRELNIAKARFTAEAYGLERLTLIREDVRALQREQLGGFDVVLCLGLLYHLDFPEVLRFLERLSEVCDGFAVFDTHVCLRRGRTVRDGQRVYRGQTYLEHSPRASASKKQRSTWASLDNPNAFWFTRASLINALADVGFTSVYECEAPPEPSKRADRRTIVAVKGSHVSLRTAPELAARRWERAPERRPLPLLRNHLPGTDLLKRILLNRRAGRG
ncbi:MAG: SAM-dependent methyltransferase [Solirubrobacterales bacterium]|nr:MAG: SAM-dependent methyltransferase [Solirubrobacterales bacterium]